MAAMDESYKLILIKPPDMIRTSNSLNYGVYS
jgi:hypothetical protein